MCAWIVWIWSLSPSNHPRSDHAPIVIVIQSEHLKQSISPRNQSAKHPDSRCFGINGVVIGSALSKGWCSGPEAFRAGHFLRLDWNWKPRMKSLWHPGYKVARNCESKNCLLVVWMGGRSVGRTVTWLPNFLRWVDLLSYGAQRMCEACAWSSAIKIKISYCNFLFCVYKWASSLFTGIVFTSFQNFSKTLS